MHTVHHSIPTIPHTAMSTHMSHYTRAMMFIQSHGHFAAITKDGLLALSEVRNAPGLDVAFVEGDVFYEEPHLFEVDQDGMVSSREVREWLGY